MRSAPVASNLRLGVEAETLDSAAWDVRIPPL
jgi:hypothetical protein